MKKRVTAGTVCIVIGILLIAAVIGYNLSGYWQEKELMNAFRQDLGKQSEQAAQEGESSSSPAAARKQEEEVLAPLLGSMQIPKIKLETTIREGDANHVIRSSLGHRKETALPWDDTGNCVIAGHRNYSFGRFFNRLDEIEVGDEVQITDTDGTQYRYEVTEIAIVEPDAVEVLEQTEEFRLTLITCTPIYIATHRLIVTCKRI